MSPETEKHIRKSLLTDLNATPDEQKNNLVAFILDTFEKPENWPFSDQQRGELVKKLYQMAKKIKETEKL